MIERWSIQKLNKRRMSTIKHMLETFFSTKFVSDRFKMDIFNCSNIASECVGSYKIRCWKKRWIRKKLIMAVYYSTITSAGRPKHEGGIEKIVVFEKAYLADAKLFGWILKDYDLIMRNKELIIEKEY